MERNDNLGGASFGSGATGGTPGSGSAGSTGGSTGGYGSSSGAFDATGNTGSGSTGYGAAGSGAGTSSGSDFGSSSGTGSGDTSLGGRASAAKDAASDKLGQAREKASELKATLADKLEAGADRLRQRNTSGAYAGTGAAAGTLATDDRMAQMGGRLADGMQGAAEFLREGDLGRTVEQQVKEHPARTLLIALGVGYVLGKAFRR